MPLPLDPLSPLMSNEKLEIKVSNDPGVEEQYHANWKSSDSGQPDDTLLRVELRLPNAPSDTPVCNEGVKLDNNCIAYFDVMLRENTSAAKKDPAPEGVMYLVNGQTLPIKVHIAQGSLTPTSDSQHLPGNATDPATEAIPDLDFIFREEDYSDDHPELGGLMVSFNTLFLVFTLDTTVAEANAILDDLSAEIVGGEPGSAGQIEGVLLLRLPTTTQTEMIAVLEQLRANPKVKIAVQDSLLEPLTIPNSNGGTPAIWTWEVSPKDANWGLELIRVPQMWNFNNAITKQGTSTITGVHDDGFSASHPDLIYLQNLSSSQKEHGTHVAGTIGATFNNGVGVDGVNPFARLVVNSHGSTVSTGWNLLDFLSVRDDLKLVNVSLGNNWYQKSPPINPNTNIFAQNLVSNQGWIFKQLQDLFVFAGDTLSFIVAAAGNDSGLTLGNVDARWSSPMNYAGLVLGAENIMVVEAVRLGGLGGASRAGFSNINGDISALGQSIGSTSFPTLYKSKSGTSMATPHVTGLVSYLWSLEPTLTHAEIRQLLLDNDITVSGAAKPRIDAFASAMAIDGIRGNNNILMKLVDIDDGSLDGNQRLLCDDTPCTNFENDDVDGDSGMGDGTVDMADFRIWRDWLLQIEDSPDLILDGSHDHPKKDVNGNGSVDAAAQENIYPRGDFNGDGILDRTTAKFVPGSINSTVTDLDVLTKLFSDANYEIGDLQGLINSADLEIDAQTCLSQPGVAEVRSKIFETGSETEIESRDHTNEEPRHVYTAAVNPLGYTARLEALDSSGKVIGIAQEDFFFELGSDAFYNPECGNIILEPEVLELSLQVEERTIETVKLVSNGLAANYELINSIEHVSPSQDQGTVEQDSEEALDLTITCPAGAGDYPQDLELSFSDDNGNVISEAVPEIIDIELHCFEDMVIATPDPINLSAEVGQSVSSEFYLQNFGDALNYQTSAGSFVSLTNNASGVIEKEGEAIVSLTASCPDEAGEYTTRVDLSFSDGMGNVLTEGVPSGIDVNMHCTEQRNFRIYSQRHSAGIRIAQPAMQYTEHFTSDDFLGTGNIRVFDLRDGVTQETNTPIPALGFSELKTNHNLSGAFTYEYFGEERTRTVDATISYASSSSYENSVASFSGTINSSYSESEKLSIWSANRDYAAGSTQIVFDLYTNASIEATWSCNGDLEPNTSGSEGIKLHNVSTQTSVFRFRTEEDCSYSGSLSPGRYALFVDTGILYGVDFAADVNSVSESVTYSLIITVNE